MMKSDGDLTGVYPGTIKTAPTAPAAASSLSYTVIANLPTGATQFNNVKPASLRLSGSADTVPARVGDPCFVLIIGKQVFFVIIEQPNIAQCE